MNGVAQSACATTEASALLADVQPNPSTQAEAPTRPEGHWGRSSPSLIPSRESSTLATHAGNSQRHLCWQGPGVLRWQHTPAGIVEDLPLPKCNGYGEQVDKGATAMGLFRRPSSEELNAGRLDVARKALKRARKFAELDLAYAGRGDLHRAWDQRDRASSWREIAAREIFHASKRGVTIDEIVREVRDPDYDRQAIAEILELARQVERIVTLRVSVSYVDPRRRGRRRDLG